ncbi:hypothetical protein [Sphingomonas rubra]|uniref:CDP-Glycerol:Poly(Glycerophosphate) glycerophosphotransferase n=1 Tax=Sphingomonas rubra TaxID=634430 RepID=A0A1I5S906_9SPHN|nr:hypothetical protein [Sphingomonas rubra]SFP67201.1 hypothetical protein SAMN04488241_10555 [Sphingomonas rubra]
MGDRSKRERPIAVLFLGETLLIPHLWPIAAALAAAGARVDLWVATGVHEALLTRWSAGMVGVRIRRAPGFRPLADGSGDGTNNGAEGRNPPLPAKIPTLLRLLPRLLGARAVLCAEQTSLWLPRLFPWLPVPFVKTSHGVGSMSARDDPRRRAAALMLVPSERERATYLQRGFSPARVLATGYAKAGFAERTYRALPFADGKPVVLYAPHWQRHRSSWWDWGDALVRAIAADGRWNLVFAPHQRLAETAPAVRETMAAVAGLPNVHCDLDGFAMVDGSYTAAADIYLGDTSSQVVEFLGRPRPCVFLNPRGVAWQDDPAYAQWACGEVVTAIDAVLPALARAPALHPDFAETQRTFATDSLGDASGDGGARAAAAILDFLSPLPSGEGQAAAGGAG